MLVRLLAALPAAFLLALALAAPGAARSAVPASAVVARPLIKPGDAWTYERVDYAGIEPVRTFSETVTFANARVIQIIHKPLKMDKEIDATYTAEWNAVSSPNTGIFQPDQELLRFPLRPGDTHDATYEVRFPRQGAYDVKHVRHVKVLGWEDVTVPAGKFHALKVLSEGSFERVDRDIAGSVREVMWYVPEVKRYVKWTYENWTPRGRSQWWGWELLDSDLQ